jgi:hypothetical protein
MEQNQQQPQQQQWQGTERRQSQGHYTGDERRRPQFAESAGNPGMSTQARRDEQQDRTRQQAKDQTDTH